MRKKNLLQIVLFVFCITLCISACNTQQPTEKKDASSSFTFTGTIRFMERTNSYLAVSDVPPGEYIIVNQEPQILGELAKSGKTIKVEGYTTVGADQLFIEKIDDKKYPADTAEK